MSGRGIPRINRMIRRIRDNYRSATSDRVATFKAFTIRINRVVTVAKPIKYVAKSRFWIPATPVRGPVRVKTTLVVTTAVVVLRKDDITLDEAFVPKTRLVGVIVSVAKLSVEMRVRVKCDDTDTTRLVVVPVGTRLEIDRHWGMIVVAVLLVRLVARLWRR